MYRKIGAFSSILWLLILLFWLFNSTSTQFWVGYYGVWIISINFPPRVKELLLLYYVKLRRISVYSSGSFTTSYFQHQNLLCLNTDFIYGVTDQFFCYGFLSSPDVLSDGMRSRGFHWHFHWEVLPLLDRPTCWLYSHDLPCLPFMEPFQKLQHLPRHHPALTTI